MTHVFISYSTKDRLFVQNLVRDLQNAGIDVWIDEQDLQPGTEDWEQAIRDAIRDAYKVLLIASPASRESRYVRDELEIAKMYDCPVFALWAVGETWADCVRMGYIGRQYADARGENYASAIAQTIGNLQNALTSTLSHKISRPLPDLTFTPRNPYKGLRAFTSDDRDDFFGRDRLVEELTRVLEASHNSTERFLALVGPSGSGKSSVVMAGLIPRLKEGAVPGSENWIYLDPVLPGSEPLEALAITLFKPLGTNIASILQDLDGSARSLHWLTKSLTANRDSRVVVLVDQFEELFTQTTDVDKRDHFIDLLVTAAQEPHGQTIIITTLRADFYDRPMNYVGLGELIESHSKSVLPMDLDDLRDVIEKPAALPDVQLKFEDGLVGDLLFEVRGESGALPLLQFTLRQLVEKCESRVLTRKDYSLIGGLRGALTEHAEATYAQLPGDEHFRMARALFLRLIEPGDTDQEVARRRVTQTELITPYASQTYIMQYVVNIFTQARLLTVHADTVEVSHEALIREWQRLAEWVKEARDDIRLQHILGRDVKEWLRHAKRDDYLYRGAKLEETVSWVQRNVPSAEEIEFVQASINEDRSTKMRADQLLALTETSSRITASLDHSEVVALALSALDRIIEYDKLTFWLRQDDYLKLQGAKDYEDDTMPVGVRVKIESHERLTQVVQTKIPYSIDRLREWDALPGEHGAQSWMGVPLVNQGNVIGVITLCKAEPSFYDAQTEQAALAFANQVALALANADLFREAERRVQRLSLLNRVSVALGQSLDTEDILEIALREIAQVLHVERGVGLMFERDLQIGRVVVEHPRGERPPDTIIDLQTSVTYQYIRRTVKSLIIEDMAHPDPELADVVRELVPRALTAFVLIPMAIGGQVIGAFELVGYDGPVDFDLEQTDLGRIIANLATIAIQNTSLLEQTLVRSRELETLLDMAQTSTMTLDINEVYRSVAELMQHALDMDDCALMTWDDIDNVVEVQVDVNRNGIPQRITPPGTRFSLSEYPSKLRALTQREIMVLSKDGAKPGTREYQELASFDDMVQVLVPLIVRDRVIGLVQLELEAEYRAFTHREIRLALALGSQAATAIENARLSTETANRVEELYIINDLTQTVSTTINLDELIKVVRDRVPNVADVEEIYLALYDPDTQQITFPMYVKNGVEFEVPSRIVSDDEVSYIIKNRRLLNMGSDYFSPEDLRRSLGISTSEGDIKSYLGVPLISGDQVLGVLAVRDTRRTHAFGLKAQSILTAIAPPIAGAIHTIRLLDDLRQRQDDE